MRAPRIARVIGVVLAIGIVAPAPARGNSTTAAQTEGLRLYHAGNFAEAIPYFDQVLARHPNNAEILNVRGICYLRTEQPERALVDFDRINRRGVQASRIFSGGFFPSSMGLTEPPVDLSYAESHGNRGIALLMLGRDQDALESFQQSVFFWNMPQNRSQRMARSRAGAYEGLGQAYLRLGQEAAALESYNQAISIDASDPNAFAGRGDVLASQRLFNEAIADFTEAIRLDATSSRAFASRGIVYYGLGRDGAALNDLDRAVGLDPKFAKALSYRGATHARLGRNELAIADYDALIKLLPQNAGAYKDRGGVLIRLGRFEEAIKDLDESIRLDPKRSTAFQNRGLAYTSLGHYERAIEDSTEAIRLDPENAGAYSNRGRAHFATGGFDEAIVDLSLAIKFEPRNAITHFNRAEAFARLGMNDRALQDYMAAVQISPNLAPAYAAIGRIQSQLGHRDEAIRDYDMALRLDPKGVDVFQDRGNARREGGTGWVPWPTTIARLRSIRSGPISTWRAGGAVSVPVPSGRTTMPAPICHSRDGMNRSSPYMALLAVLGARGTPREPEMRQLLAEALTNIQPGAWPAPILRYFRGDVTESKLVQIASGLRQQTEVHAFIGLDASRPAIAPRPSHT